MQIQNKITQISKIITIWLLLLTVTSSAFSSDNAPPAHASELSLQDSYYYYASGERIPLTPSLEWVSVKFASDIPSEQATALQDFGALVGSPDQARQIPRPKLTLLPLQEGLTIQSLGQGIDSMRANTASFLWVNPVFQSGDTEMVITDEFIAAFPIQKTRVEIDAINSAHNVKMARPLLGGENTFILRVLPEANTDSLSMANLYQESGVAILAAQ